MARYLHACSKPVRCQECWDRVQSVVEHQDETIADLRAKVARLEPANAALAVALWTWVGGYSLNEMKGFICGDACGHESCSRWRLTYDALSDAGEGYTGPGGCVLEYGEDGWKVVEPCNAIKGWLPPEAREQAQEGANE